MRYHAEQNTMFDLDGIRFDIHCPKCDFLNPVTFKQVRIKDMIICRGCKANIQLEDQMSTVRKSVRDIRQAMREIDEQLSGIGEITIRL
jgi:peptide subunit release factor 1 (eRF1)